MFGVNDLLFVAWCLLRVVCCLFVLFVGVRQLAIVFSLLDCGLQFTVSCLLSGAVVMIVAGCLLFVDCCDYCLLRLLLVVC